MILESSILGMSLLNAIIIIIGAIYNTLIIMSIFIISTAGALRKGAVRVTGL